uniref:Uncharacterized protein n=1 Tax=Escherichia coli TaxID=562 RepID=A0A6G9I2P0_ECOLX|nr:hypothetical protein [Escherichia coli]
MQWISTASQKIDERLYRVCVWVKNITLMRLTALAYR